LQRLKSCLTTFTGSSRATQKSAAAPGKPVQGIHRADAALEVSPTAFPPSKYGWLKRWQQDGIEGLANKPKSGRPAKADEAYSQALERVLEQEPPELGYEFSIWTVARLQAHLEKETGIDLSEPRLRALMQRQGYRYRRPKYDLGHLQDKAAKAQAAELLNELKKRPAETILNSSLGTKQP